ncbi:universal stress protein [uncultured Roseibium sp.]|uniref:universal stress protein n=1 Tax=uncultured Roseibium sp. TaxID=1936171 RepID=UPI002615FBDD|nr:universal stress protein [uncultured Roseibium sp.]
MADVKIIAAVDLHHRESDACVVREAIMLAQSHEAAVELVFVIPDQQNTYVQAYIPDEMRDQVEVDARKDLAAYAGQFDWQDVPHSTDVLRGVVYEKLIEHADLQAARFIVIGASRPTVKDLFIGPNAARVSRFASCSVLVVRPD